MELKLTLTSLDRDCFAALGQFLMPRDKLCLAATCKTMRRTFWGEDALEAAVTAKVRSKSLAFVQNTGNTRGGRDREAPGAYLLRSYTLGTDALLRRALDAEHTPVRRALDLALFVGLTPPAFVIAAPLTVCLTCADVDLYGCRDLDALGKRQQRHDQRRTLRRELKQFNRALKNAPALLPPEKLREGLKPIADHLEALEKLRMRAPEKAIEVMVATQGARHRRWTKKLMGRPAKAVGHGAHERK